MKSTIKVTICADGTSDVSYSHSQGPLAIGWGVTEGDDPPIRKAE
jgi:hypothetical protein